MKQTIRRFAPPQFIHWGKCLTDAGYRHTARELAQLEGVPRYQPTTTRVLGQELEVVDSASFIFMYREIFEQEIYRFRARTEAPYIIDCGSNIGLSVLYFKKLYPACRIVAFEPDDRIFAVLQRNIRRSGHEDVELHCRALWTEETSLSFMSEGADGGRLATEGDSRDKMVRTVRLSDYLDGHVDFLKLDIEGAETEVLADCADKLSNVENLFVEYHSFANQPQTLHVLTGLLAEAGFRLHVHPQGMSPRPFISRNVYGRMDMQLNIFAFRS